MTGLIGASSLAIEDQPITTMTTVARIDAEIKGEQWQILCLPEHLILESMESRFHYLCGAKDRDLTLLGMIQYALKFKQVDDVFTWAQNRASQKGTIVLVYLHGSQEPNVFSPQIA